MSRSIALRPCLLPGLQPLWRDRRTVQFGTRPALATVLEFPHPEACRVLTLLDGSRTRATVLTAATRLGMPPDATDAMIETLAAAGLLIGASDFLPAGLDPQRRTLLTPEAASLAYRRPQQRRSPARILRDRARAKVVVVGAYRLAELIGDALTESGIGLVAHVRAPGGSAVPRRAETGRVSTMTRTTSATTVVLVGAAARTALRGARSHPTRLAVEMRQGAVVVGPLVPPVGGPCLDCLDLHRTDRDPAWPRLAAQLAQDRADDIDDGLAATTRMTAAGVIAREVLAHLDGGRPDTTGATLEITEAGIGAPGSWAAHPRCGCAPHPRRRVDRVEVP